MARFETFGDYMFSLLFTPLRKGKEATNQFYIFFKIVGKLFDDCKQDIFRVRTESMVISASETMLNEHGKDRRMTRMKNEDTEAFRTRLSMKAILSERAGTKEGVLLAVKSLGYLNSFIVPYSSIDPTRWAEFLVKINLSLDYDKAIEYSTLRKTVREIKEASAKDNYLFTFDTEFIGIGEEYTMLTVSNEIDVNWWSNMQTLDGSMLLNGNIDIDTELVNYPIIVTYNSNPVEIIEID